VPKCILIVDDNETVRQMLRHFLEAETGFRVCGEAVDGYDAIEKAHELQPDLIILDLTMPRMGGIEAAKILKQMLPPHPHCSLHFTSRRTQDIRRACRWN
jgi:YesN/AraC family two-component response regulator